MEVISLEANVMIEETSKSYICPCNEGERNDEEHNSFKIKLLHMPLKLLILLTTLQRIGENSAHN